MSKVFTYRMQAQTNKRTIQVAARCHIGHTQDMGWEDVEIDETKNAIDLPRSRGPLLRLASSAVGICRQRVSGLSARGAMSLAPRAVHLAQGVGRGLLLVLRDTTVVARRVLLHVRIESASNARRVVAAVGSRGLVRVHAHVRVVEVLQSAQSKKSSVIFIIIERARMILLGNMIYSLGLHITLYIKSIIVASPVFELTVVELTAEPWPYPPEVVS